jgi:hypothetical protein
VCVVIHRGSEALDDVHLVEEDSRLRIYNIKMEALDSRFVVMSHNEQRGHVVRGVNRLCKTCSHISIPHNL